MNIPRIPMVIMLSGISVSNFACTSPDSRKIDSGTNVDSPGDTSSNDSAVVNELEEIVPLFDSSTELEPSNHFDNGTAIVTRFADSDGRIGTHVKTSFKVTIIICLIIGFIEPLFSLLKIRWPKVEAPLIFRW